jgi:aspartyl-tRNA(Asn)/glutamyl-tRNA(Gln) amidotransferase subunit A
MSTFDPIWSGVRRTAQAVESGEISAVEVTEAHVARMESLEPGLNAFITRNAKAVKDAGKVPRGPLAGVPISIKDLVLTRGMPTTAGSRTFGKGLPGTSDAPVTRRLRRAGAVLLGKTNLHELAMGVTTVNEHFGPAHNPWDTTRVAGGSSGGSAVAVAAGMGAASVGSDTRGSIRIPAACCGVTGLKPTFGLIDTEGVVPLAATLDHLGPITRSVEDAAIVLGVMAGNRRSAARWLHAVDDSPEPALRLAICDALLENVDGAIASPIAEALQVFQRGGWSIGRVEVPLLAESHAASGVITSAEALAFHIERLDANPEGIGPIVRSRLEKGRALTAVDYVKAEMTRALFTAAWHELFEGADCVLAPVLAALPPGIGDNHVMINGQESNTLDAFTRLTALANMAGIPALAIPCGFSAEGLPVSLQLIAAQGREDILLALGAWYQRETNWHTRKPSSV